MTDGRCPSCGKNTNDRRGTDPNKTIVGLRAGRALPEICHACGVPTRRTQRLNVVSQQEGGDIAPGVGTLFINLIKPLAWMHKVDVKSRTVELSLLVPTCEQCSAAMKELTPHYIDFDEKRFDLIVHREFKRALETV